MRMLRVLTAATCLVSIALGADPTSMAAAASVGTTSRRPATTTSTAAIKVVPVRTGLNMPSGFTFAPNGTIWYLERSSGEIRTLNRKTGATHLFFTIGGVDGSSERGALGIALDPAFPTKPYVYFYVTRLYHGTLHNQVVRIRKDGPTGSGMRILMTTQGSASQYHNGGRILFGPDHKLYVVVGDAHDSSNAQDLTSNLRGKILRLDRDGSAAAGNPYGRIWSFGHRNSYGFTFDPKTGRLWETENGPECNDEINRIVKGGNFGWGSNETCSGTHPRDTNNSGPKPRHLPETYFRTTIGITGAAFCSSCGLGGGLRGDLIFGDVNTSSIRAIGLNATRTGCVAGSRRVLLTTSTGGIHSVEVAPDGRIFFSGPTGIYRLAPA
jgi:aldose sugar dehydrogenase